MSQFIGDTVCRLLGQFTSIHIEDKGELSTKFDIVERKLITIHNKPCHKIKRNNCNRKRML